MYAIFYPKKHATNWLQKYKRYRFKYPEHLETLSENVLTLCHGQHHTHTWRFVSAFISCYNITVGWASTLADATG
jgi:hypothetical protein